MARCAILLLVLEKNTKSYNTKQQQYGSSVAWQFGLHQFSGPVVQTLGNLLIRQPGDPAAW